MAETLYDVLGVAKDATPDAIRKTYRKLARKHHPDVNPGDQKAEERFKKVAHAYEVLSDEKRRAAYDEFGEEALQSGFDPDKAREYAKWKTARGQQRASRFDQGPVEFDFAEMFGRAARGPRRGHDLHASVELVRELVAQIEGLDDLFAAHASLEGSDAAWRKPQEYEPMVGRSG